MTGYRLSKSHPRYKSLYYRDLLAAGVKKGITSLQGLTAHGRGEAFDYLLGEKTHPFAQEAIRAAGCLLLSSRYPILSINGNSAILTPKEFITLAGLLDAPIEINLFHYEDKRVKKIAAYLKKMGARSILLPDGAKILGIASDRRRISSCGQAKGDVIFVPLEDGDRTETLVAMGKKVIAIDLNPLSRTARSATITIVDNIVRVMPLLIKTIRSYRSKSDKWLESKLGDYNNQAVLHKASLTIKRYNKI